MRAEKKNVISYNELEYIIEVLLYVLLQCLYVSAVFIYRYAIYFCIHGKHTIFFMLLCGH